MKYHKKFRSDTLKNHTTIMLRSLWFFFVLTVVHIFSLNHTRNQIRNTWKKFDKKTNLLWSDHKITLFCIYEWFKIYLGHPKNSLLMYVMRERVHAHPHNLYGYCCAILLKRFIQNVYTHFGVFQYPIKKVFYDWGYFYFLFSRA